MDRLSVKTKGNVRPEGNPRVYFTCHPQDFERSFDKICEDIFMSHDCAIYYTPDMESLVEDENWETDLGRMNLFVVPVSFKLLTQKNRAMDQDIAFAMERKTAILPLMLESGIDDFYKTRFGERQYLNPYSSDLTEISYEEKLKGYLDSVLLNDETAKRVRAAFDAYIFLSYRKKDRRYANELIRIIHDDPVCRDIAVWFDEYLTPGESFKENIDRILQDSKLFTLLVTPNLLEEPEGKPNFVMDREYPAARNAGMEILPAEMQTTNRHMLEQKYHGIPSCVDISDPEARERLLEAIRCYALQENNDDPMHNYLIGLAYLKGIDVEVDDDRGVELITMAAEAELPEAMKKLYKMYGDGDSVSLDYSKQLFWAKKIYEYSVRNQGEEHPDTLVSLSNLSVSYSKAGNIQKALELGEKVYELRRRILGEDHPHTLVSLGNLASSYSDSGNIQKAMELDEKVYELRRRILGEEHPDTLRSLSNLASSYSDTGNKQKALELDEKVYELRRRILGEEHPDTLLSLSNLARSYSDTGNKQKALELMEEVYNISARVFGREDAITSTRLLYLIDCCKETGDEQKLLLYSEERYQIQKETLGENHPYTIQALSYIAILNSNINNKTKALELMEQACLKSIQVLGKNHSSTEARLGILVWYCMDVGEKEKKIVYESELYDCRKMLLGESHSETKKTLQRLITDCKNANDLEKLQLWRQEQARVARNEMGDLNSDEME